VALVAREIGDGGDAALRRDELAVPAVLAEEPASACSVGKAR